MKFFSFFLLSILACSGTRGSTQNGTDEATRISESTLGQTVSALDPHIWHIHQDRAGHYWFGSNGSGVYRYDGDKLTQFTTADGLAGSRVRDIQEDSAGHIFISTYGGVSKFDGQSFTTLKIADASPESDGWELNPEDVWIVFNPGNSGPLRYDGKVLHQLTLAGSPAEAVILADNPNTRFLPSAVYSIYKDRRGHMWFGTANAGLCRYDGKILSWMHEERLTTTPSGGSFGIRSIFEDRSGDFWICNTRQRFQIAPKVRVDKDGSHIQYESKVGLPEAGQDSDDNFNYYPSMTQDAAGALWMACGSDGVWKFDGDKVTRFPIAEDSYVIRIYQDRKGKIWIGTLDHGAFTLHGKTFEPFLPLAK